MIGEQVKMVCVIVRAGTVTANLWWPLTRARRGGL